MESVLVFLSQNDYVLLGRKKRGHGVGKYNGAGGKVHAGETPEQAAQRECEEEFGVICKALTATAMLHFYQEPTRDEYSNQDVTVYMCTAWQGEPKESDELKPEWFAKDSVPYDQMWSDDVHWLPQVLAGQKVKGEFHFDSNYNLTAWEVNHEQ